MTITITKPTVGGSEDSWGTQINTALDTIVDGVNLAMPSGGIIMWSGTVANVPSGWYLCDGTNGTPNLVDRFIVGSASDSGQTHDIGDTGGANDRLLTSANIPSHTHSFSATTASNGSHTHTYSGTTSTKSLTGTLTAGKPRGYSGIVTLSAGDQAGGGDGSQSSANKYNIDASHNHTFSGTTSSDGSHTHTVSGTTGSTGSGSAFDNRPAYYALAFIMKA